MKGAPSKSAAWRRVIMMVRSCYLRATGRADARKSACPTRLRIAPGFGCFAESSGRRATGLRLARRHEFAHTRKQLAPVLDRVFQRIEAANEKGGDAEVVVVEQRLGHLVRRADQSRGIPLCPGQRR